MKSEIAEYILKLERASKETHRAEDRSLYERYLAGAGVLLALVETNADVDRIEEAVDTHQRLWGYTWLQDEECKVPAEAWRGTDAGRMSKALRMITMHRR